MAEHREKSILKGFHGCMLLSRVLSFWVLFIVCYFEWNWVRFHPQVKGMSKLFIEAVPATEISSMKQTQWYVPPTISAEDGKRSNFQNVVSIQNTIQWTKTKNSEEDFHPLDCCQWIMYVYRLSLTVS
jgi:hypothetical protein